MSEEPVTAADEGPVTAADGEFATAADGEPVTAADGKFGTSADGKRFATAADGELVAAAGDQRRHPFASWMGSMWLYTALRFGLFFALWGLLVLFGLKPLFAALLGLVLSVPLSLVLLAKPRAMFTANLQARVDAHREQRTELDHELDPDAASHE